jgi:hypothetical protein
LTPTPFLEVIIFTFLHIAENKFAKHKELKRLGKRYAELDFDVYIRLVGASIEQFDSVLNIIAREYGYI